MAAHVQLFSNNYICSLHWILLPNLFFSRLCQNRLSVSSHLEALHVFALASNRIIRYIRTDAELITSLATAWATSNKITFIPSIPHEHDTVCSIERVHCTLQKMVVKSLVLKPHL